MRVVPMWCGPTSKRGGQTCCLIQSASVTRPRPSLANSDLATAVMRSRVCRSRSVVFQSRAVNRLSLGHTDKAPCRRACAPGSDKVSAPDSRSANHYARPILVRENRIPTAASTCHPSSSSTLRSNASGTRRARLRRLLLHFVLGKETEPTDQDRNRRSLQAGPAAGSRITRALSQYPQLRLQSHTNRFRGWNGPGEAAYR